MLGAMAEINCLQNYTEVILGLPPLEKKVHNFAVIK